MYLEKNCRLEVRSDLMYRLTESVGKTWSQTSVYYTSVMKTEEVSFDHTKFTLCTTFQESGHGLYICELYIIDNNDSIPTRTSIYQYEMI